MSMKLVTQVSVGQSPFRLTHQRPLLMVGSCFTEHIGQMLSQGGFEVMQNPFGILYNPFSIVECLHRCLTLQPLGNDDMVCHHGLWHSWLHHGSFSNSDAQQVVNSCMQSQQRTHELMERGCQLIVTLGDAHYYTLHDTDYVVANCHKLPASCFDLHQATPAAVVDAFVPLIERLQQYRIQVLFTISPIRHWAYGAHGSQLGKAVLLLAVDELVQRYPKQCFYFPAYEIVMDELRDYRFYADDLLHPTPLAQRIIFERLIESCADKDTQRLLEQYQMLHNMESHRPINTDSDEYRCFEAKLTELRNEIKNNHIQ